MSKIKSAIREYNPLIEIEGNTGDETFLNYLALYYCIKGLEVDGKVKYPSVSGICSVFDLNKYIVEEERVIIKQKQPTNINLRTKFLLENIITGEKRECNKLELSEITGIQINRIAMYVNKKSIYKKCWKIHRLNSEMGNSKHIKLTNIETKEIIKMKSIADTARFFGVTGPAISSILKKEIDYKGYKIEYAD